MVVAKTTIIGKAAGLLDKGNGTFIPKKEAIKVGTARKIVTKVSL
jgi:hypothetical protein